MTRSFVVRTLALGLMLIAGTRMLGGSDQDPRQQAVDALRKATAVITFSPTAPRSAEGLVFADPFRAVDPEMIHLRHLPTLKKLDFNASVRLTDIWWLKASDR